MCKHTYLLGKIVCESLYPSEAVLMDVLFLHVRRTMVDIVFFFSLDKKSEKNTTRNGKISCITVRGGVTKKA